MAWTRARQHVVRLVALPAADGLTSAHVHPDVGRRPRDAGRVVAALALTWRMTRARAAWVRGASPGRLGGRSAAPDGTIVPHLNEAAQGIVERPVMRLPTVRHGATLAPMGKFKLRKGRRPNQPPGGGTDWDHLQTWAQALMMAEGAELRARVAVVDAGRFREWDVEELLEEATAIDYTYQVAALLARTAPANALVAVVMTFTPKGIALPKWAGPRLWQSWIVARSREGAFRQRWWRVIPDGVSFVTQSDKAHIEANYLSESFYIDPAIESQLAERGIVGAVRRIEFAPPKGPAPAKPDPASEPGPAPALPTWLRAQWETLRLHAGEIGDIRPAALLPSPSAIPGGAPPYRYHRRTFADLAVNGWSSEAQATFLAFPCSAQPDLRQAIATLEAIPGLPHRSLGFALSRSAQIAVVLRGDVALGIELAERLDAHMTAWTAAAGGLDAWLADGWPDSPKFEHRHPGSVAISCAAAWLGWRAFLASSAGAREHVTLADDEARWNETMAAGAALRDRLLDRAAVGPGTAGERIVAASRRLLKVVASLHGETDEARWREAVFDPSRNDDAIDCLADVAAWHGARLHSTLTVIAARQSLRVSLETQGDRPHLPKRKAWRSRCSSWGTHRSTRSSFKEATPGWRSLGSRFGAVACSSTARSTERPFGIASSCAAPSGPSAPGAYPERSSPRPHRLCPPTCPLRWAGRSPRRP